MTELKFNNGEFDSFKVSKNESHSESSASSSDRSSTTKSQIEPSTSRMSKSSTDDNTEQLDVTSASRVSVEMIEEQELCIDAKKLNMKLETDENSLQMIVIDSYDDFDF